MSFESERLLLQVTRVRFGKRLGKYSRACAANLEVVTRSAPGS